MADEDKQFEATAQKLRKARNEGQVIKSKDLSTAISLLAMFMLLYYMAPFIWDQVARLFILLYEQIPNKSIENIGLQYLYFLTLVPAVLIVLPILFAALLVAVLGDLMQIGPLITGTPLVPKLDKLNPVNGFKNIFLSVKTLFELAKNIVKVLILGFIGFLVFKAHIPAILNLCAVENTFSILHEFGRMIVEFVLKAGIMFLVIAGADYMFTRWKFLKDQKMSFKEIKDEYKNTEGDPHVKAALRQRRMQMLQQTMLEAVATADFVTVNPVHIAVALKYNSEEMRAPKVIAKGTELFAKKIIKIAKEHNIPVVENPPIARALFRLVDINKEIPPELYKAVAEILMFVYNLRKRYETSTT
ncbi:MAG: flagellar biosynthesis protein FlhB [Candidatus Melainabacteria bacterium RIFOXYA12_FULL_32_12]|nr:MAG: flagellar biosynthesis protein FlhB [Candidatus Melainabacteria bacterium GWF2_32_7]OGI16809.1 MAG: flagellar biosynthesis protein FlhB [Candidatus Melainabacteria bacterium RIFOXYA2_FULL_32_9]OGI26502.1 MAG: flagellar biosynthesis protein FlhB [Candidatus Melainabacteria bacterium RIFOXYA12_FULL_32_12]